MVNTIQLAAAAAVVILATMVIPEVGALQCYVCNSKYNGSTCLSPPNKIHLQTCPMNRDNQEPVLCRTMFITMGNEEATIDRRCGYIKQHKDCVNTATFQIKSTTCQCDKDACNPASHNTPTMMFVALSAIVGIALCRSS